MPAFTARPVDRTLARRRRAKGLTLRELARLSGINYIKVHYFEHGLEPRRDEVRRLADALGCTAAELLGEVRRG
jgi:transcriptional regulator with XRE-family HTH domain